MLRKYWYYAQSLWNHKGFLTFGTFKRMVRGAFLTKIGRQQVRNVQMALTMRCNFKCNFCSSNLLLNRGDKELSLDEWKRVVSELKALGCTHFDLTGGEPTILPWSQLTDLISFINEKRDCVVSLATNGWNLYLPHLQDLKNAGLTAVEFNVQSTNAVLHDEELARVGSWAHTRQAIDWARQVGLQVCANTSLRDDNFEEIERLMTWCDEEKIHCLLNLGGPTGRLVDKPVRITDRKKQYYDLLYSHPYSRSDTTYNFRGFDLCPGGVEKLYITAYGDVMQCTFVQISFGNVRQEPLSLIHKRFLSHPWMLTKEQCKHTFNEEFRNRWVEPIIDNIPPTKLINHPNYERYFHAEPMPPPDKYKNGLKIVSKYVLKNKLSELVKWIYKTEKGYDIGAGLGQYTKALKELGYDVHAIEPLEGYCEFAIPSKAEDWMLPGDYCFLINVLHHSDDPVGLLKHLKTLCPKLIVSEVNRRNLAVRLFVKIFLPWEEIDGQLDEMEVRAMLFLAGWEVKTQYSKSLLGIPFVYNWYVCQQP